MKIAIHILILVCLTVVNSHSKSVYVDGVKKNYSTQKLSNNEYIEFGEMHRLLFSKFSANKTNLTLSKGNIEIKFQQGSFFIALKNNDNARIAQMKLPVAKNGKNYLISEESIYSAIDSLGIYKVEFSDEVTNLISQIDELIDEESKPKKEDISYKKLPKIKFDLKLDFSKPEVQINELSENYNEEKEDLISTLNGIKQGLVELNVAFEKKVKNDEFAFKKAPRVKDASSDLIITAEEDILPKQTKRKSSIEKEYERAGIKPKFEKSSKSKKSSDDSYYIPNNLKRSEVEEKLK
jgi:hypothetical protein